MDYATGEPLFPISTKFSIISGQPVYDKATGKPVYYAGLKDFLLDYEKNHPYDKAVFQKSKMTDYVDLLSRDSKYSPVDKRDIDVTNNLRNPISWAQCRDNARKLLPEAMMYGAGLINTFWANVNDGQASNINCLIIVST